MLLARLTLLRGVVCDFDSIFLVHVAGPSPERGQQSRAGLAAEGGQSLPLTRPRLRGLTKCTSPLLFWNTPFAKH